MLNTALVLFVVAAAGGLALLVLRIRDAHLPMGLALAHGVFAASGLVVLVMAIVSKGAGAIATLPLILFVIAAVGGFGLFSFHLRGEKVPVSLALIHGTLAVLAFVILLRRVVFNAYGVL